MPASPVGIIDSLASGFEIVAAHLQILLLPLGIDLFLWIGPRITLRPLILLLEQFWLWLAPYSDSTTKTQYLQLAQDTHKLAQSAPDQYLPIMMPPTLLGGRRASVLPFDFKPVVIETWPGNLIAITVALLSSVILYEICYGWITHYMLNEPFSPLRFTRQVSSILFQSLLALAASMIVVIASGVLFLSAATVAWLIGGDTLYSILVWLVLFIFLMFIVPACMMAVFTLHSMFLNRRNILAAMWDSIRVVQWNMLPTTILLILVGGIYFAMNVIWSLAGRDSWLVLAAMGGNAFISTGLMAATFVFYKDRYRHWRELREAVLAELERRRAQQDDNRQA